MVCSHLLCSLRSDGACGVEQPAPPSEPPPITRDLNEAIRQRIAQRALGSLAEFVRFAWKETDPGVPLKWNWHHQLLCDVLQRMFFEWRDHRFDSTPDLTIQRLLINIPPGTAKSRIISVFFPAWAWLHVPQWRVLCVSMNPKVAARDAIVCRSLIESHWYQGTFQPEWGPSGDVDARDWFLNTAGGERRSFGFTGSVTGLRSDCIICDDPNDPQDAYSETMRASVNDTWDRVISNRLNDLAVGLMIGIQQRVHEDDWSAHVLRQGWEHLRLPLLYEPPETVGCVCASCKRGGVLFGDLRDPRTTDGEVLHPSRFSERVIATERGKGSIYFAGQFQQRPAPADGEVFRTSWFKPIELDKVGTLDDILISCDLANSSHASKTNSNNALVVMGRKGSWRYVLDVELGRWTTREICDRLERLQDDWSKRSKRIVKVLVEKKAAGPSVIDELQQYRELQGVITDDDAQRAHDSKLARAMAIQPQVEAGNVMIVKGAPWVDAFIHELVVFKGVGDLRDDQVDAFTMALNYWRGSKGAARAMAMATR